MGITLVLGASGYVGSHLVPRLVTAGQTVRAAARGLDVLKGREWLGVDLVSADLLQQGTLAAALEGVEIVYYLVHSMGSGGDFAAKDRRAAGNLRDAAAIAGVKRIIYLGGLQQAGKTSRHLASRGEVGQILREGKVPVTELRASIIVGPGSAGFEILRDLVNHLPVMIAPRWVRSKTQPIALEDLLSYLVAVAAIDTEGDLVLDAIGPETLTYNELITQFASVVGKKRTLIPFPFITPRLSSYWLDLVTSVPSSVARPLVEGLRRDLIGDDRELNRLVPLDRKTYREAVHAAFRIEQNEPLPARWSEGALSFRGYNPEASFYAKGESTVFDANVPADELWATVRSIGGRRGFFHANWLWDVRGLLDRSLGGPGMRRGRRHPTHLRVGDAVDFWRVVAHVPGKRLTLVAEMRVPGSAVLEFEVSGIDDAHSRLTTTARFHPVGLFGLLYWHLVSPLHGWIFKGMPRGIIREAERLHGRVA